jgi:hypothetical protein
VSGFDRFLDTFKKQGVDVEVDEVHAALSWLYWSRCDGTDRIFRRIPNGGYLVGSQLSSFGFDTSSELTAHGAKAVAQRRAKAQVAKLTRRAQQRKAAKVRRKRQWRRKVDGS